MTKDTVWLFSCLLVACCFITPAFLAAPRAEAALSSRWLYVGGSGPGNYTRIQDAIDNASAGDRVFVYHGWYPESIRVNTSLQLIAENQQAIIDGRGLGFSAVRILAKAVTMAGFTVLNNQSELGMATILVAADSCQILGNFVSSTDSGDTGIRIIDAEGTAVQGNRVIHHFAGISLIQANHSLVANNSFEGDTEGIRLYTSNDNVLQGNTIRDDYDGLILFDSCSNTIQANTVRSCTRDGIYLQYLTNGSAYNVISHNTFMGNGRDAFFIDGKAKNTWDENYWHRYLTRPKLVPGARAVFSIPGAPFHFPGLTVCIPWVAVDWHPLKTPGP